MSDIGIVIVTYNSAAEIGPCLEAALGSGAEIVVVDNASHDGTVAEVARRGVPLIANPANRGFAAAVNQGFAALAQCPYILVLNPDAILATPLDALRDACARPGIAAAGGRLEDPQGRPQVGFMVRRFPTPAALAFEALLHQPPLAPQPSQPALPRARPRPGRLLRGRTTRRRPPHGPPFRMGRDRRLR